MIRLLIPVLAGLAAMLGTYAAAEYVKMRLRLAWHRHLTRRHGRMLQRVLPRPRGGDWYWPEPAAPAASTVSVAAGRATGGGPS